MSSKDIETKHPPKNSLKNAEYDLKFLLNRGYRKKGAVNFVSNKYLLGKNGRNYLVRKIFSDKKCDARKKKLVDIRGIKDRTIFIDGYNVLITVESIYNQENDYVILCNDGVLRDIKAVFGKYRCDLSTESALIQIILLLADYDPACVTFLYDSPVSKSGNLAKLTENLIKSFGLNGSGVTSKSVDFELVKISGDCDGIVATSDSAVMDRVKSVLDIPYWISENIKKN